MPSWEIEKDFKEGHLHSGPGGPIVKNPAQMRAIKLSYLRKEGHHIPKKRGLRHSYARARAGDE